MKLEEQVCSSKLSKRLKELGVKQEGVFTWAQDGEAGPGWHLFYDIEEVGFGEYRIETKVSAFTVAELGEVLPSDIEVHETGFFLAIGRAIGNKWYVTYRNDRVHSRLFPYTDGETEADARAKMLIYLIENKLINKA